MPIKNANDFRSKQTESMVRKALVKIMESKPIEKITVTELCKTASINRNTFYAHYYRPEDVLKQVFNMWEIDITTFSYYDDPRAITDKYINLLIEHDELLKIIKNTDIIHNQLVRSLLALFREKTVEAWKNLRPDLSEEELNTRYLYTEGGSIAIVLSWIESGLEEPSSRIANTILEYSMKFCKDIWYYENGEPRFKSI